VETIIAFERLAMENVEAVLLGREPLTAVNMHQLRSTDGVNGHGDEMDTDGIDMLDDHGDDHGNGHSNANANANANGASLASNIN